jgi:exodeoxyribonuclease V beta subunit
MFEFSDFTNDERWSDNIECCTICLNSDFTNDERYNIEKALGRYYPSSLQNDAVKEWYVQNLKQLMKLTVETSFEIKGQSIRLNEVDNFHRVNELEFNFPIPELFQPADLEKVVGGEDDARKIATSTSKVYGMMTGFVDLFFEYKGKYYILDWKSNFLGDELSAYSKENLMEGMNESNYHLQYLIYTVAIDKYLTNRLGDTYDFDEHFGGVCYVFLRGVREGKENGFFAQEVKREEVIALKKNMRLD